MFFKKETVTKTFLTLFIVVLLLVMVSGAPHFGMTMTMDMDGHMTMSDCLMPGITAICNMTPLEHMASWQSMFTSVLQEYGTVLFLVLLAFAVTWYLSHALSEPRHRERFVFREKRRDKIFDPLRLALSRGLIHSKAF